MMFGWLLFAGIAAGPEDVAFFENKVRPVLVERCYSCHSTSVKRIRGGLVLDSKEGWEKGGDSGPAIVPGKPAESLLVKAIEYVDADVPHMPPTGKLSPAAMAALSA